MTPISTHGVDVDVTQAYAPIVIEGVQSPERTQRDAQRLAAVTKGKTTFNFVTEGIERALKQAKAAAGDRDVVLQGANIVQQYLVAGVVDEIRIHLVPVLLGTGIRLFEHLGVKPIELKSIDVIDTPGVTHLQYRVVKDK